MTRIELLRGRAVRAAGLFVLGLAWTAAAALPASAQEVVIRFQKPLEHDVQVVLKLIQVSVTDRKGIPVSDLSRDEFIIYDNGQRIVPTAFERHILDVPPPAPAGVDPAAAAPPPSVTRKFLLFFDFAFNTPKGVEKAKTAALEFIEGTLRPGDEVGVVSFSMLKSLVFHEFFTADHAHVRKTVEDLNVKGTAGRIEDVEQSYWRAARENLSESTSAGGGEGGTPAASGQVFSWQRGETVSLVHQYLDRISALAKSLRYVPGQKNVILFSTGIPNSLLTGTGTLSGGRMNETGDFTLRTKNEETIQELSTANCTLFTFDTREQSKPAALFDYDQDTFGRSRDMSATQALELFRDEKQTGRYTLERFSNQTGGNYFGNIREYEMGMEKVQNRTGTFYVLGYPVREEWDGRYHEIKVETVRKGVVIHSQSGYFNPKPFAEYTDLEKQLHLFDLALSERPLFQTPLAASLAALPVPSIPAANLLLLARLPLETVEKLDGDKIEIVTFIFDEGGTLKSLRRSVETLKGYKDRTVFVSSLQALPSGSYNCRIVVRDLVTGAAASASARAFVTDPPGPGLALQTPMLLASAGGGVYLQIRNRTAEEPDWLSLYPFNADLLTPILNPIPRGVNAVFALLPCVNVGIEEPQVTFRAAAVNVTNGERTELQIYPLDTMGEGGLFIQALEVVVSGLETGSYFIYFYIEDAGAGSRSRATSSLTIR